MKHVRMIGVWIACVFGSIAILLRMLVCLATNTDKAKEIAASVSRAGNAAANGDPRETISSRAHRARSEGRLFGCVLCGVLDWLDPNHCRDAAENDDKPTPESLP